MFSLQKPRKRMGDPEKRVVYPLPPALLGLSSQILTTALNSAKIISKW